MNMTEETAKFSNGSPETSRAEAEGSPSPFHAGEQAVQERLGVRDIEDWARQVVRGYLPEQHREFHTAQPFLVTAARDRAGRPWATLLDGPEGFVTSPDPHRMVLASEPHPGDALSGAFVPGADIGILGIELETRRRNRVNGCIGQGAAGAITVNVAQSFGNCPQYIRERRWRRAPANQPGKTKRCASLTEAQRVWIDTADTFFIASGYRSEGGNPAFGMDASHRGGDRGFVRTLDGGSLRFPDYAGNNHFNTVGNLVLDPRVGLLFVEFETGSLLQVTGEASIEWDPADLADYPGARRLITVRVHEAVETRNAIALRWDADAESVRSLRLSEKIRESADVTSFVFEARDGGPLDQFEAGQHLPIEVALPDAPAPARRTYSLSGAPADARYRISVKREPKGLVSRYLHDHAEPGTIIESRRPAGIFTLRCSTCPVVLIGAGVGITPMISLLHAIAAEDVGRPVWFIHAVRDGRHHPFAGEVRNLATAHPNIHTHFAYSRPRNQDKRGTHYDSEGRLTPEVIGALVDRADAQYFLCGPPAFMAGLERGLGQLGVSAEQIHVESFGPQMLS
ncbi:FAD-binding oxidoreductase [Leisingera sp. McT4-56]|uniref:FAD-binding oxidoreductase n=1 Tax=Leisingera sp. McT4-56 TaxID=2881255 RepID=UPI001CF8A605|nr:pyridoxamine 5'-phosphate oxidase family protein [Leisingera sp. McT4-56]MCB4454612.1 pyridoxamine 5'-phosphate oxidase family protein [Leisingera sp. McT4-56]